MEETAGAPSSFAALSPRRLRASSRDGGGVVNRPPSSLTMLLSRHTRTESQNESSTTKRIQARRCGEECTIMAIQRIFATTARICFITTIVSMLVGYLLAYPQFIEAVS